MYVAFEGIDGSGKSDQIDMLVAALEAQGADCRKVAEPDETNPVGRLLRECLKSGEYPMAHAPLFLADRLILIEKTVKPMLDNKKVIVSSRSFLSTIVYQQELWEEDWLVSLHSQINRKHLPTHIFLLDISPYEAMKRMTLRSGTPEFYEKREVLQRVRERYLECARKRGVAYNIQVIDGSGTPEEVHADILSRLEGYPFHVRRQESIHPQGVVE